MKLRNKKTGEIVNAMEVDLYTDVVYLKISKDGRYDSRGYASLAKLNEEWEDAPERKGITSIGTIGSSVHIEFNSDKEAKQFEQKIMAWKRLEDNGFRFTGMKEVYPASMTPIGYDSRYIAFNKSVDEKWMRDNAKDIKLLFPGVKKD